MAGKKATKKRARAAKKRSPAAKPAGKKRAIRKVAAPAARKAAKVQKKGAAKPAVKTGAIRSLEELLVSNLVTGSAGHSGNGIDVQDLVLSLTPSTRRLGYNFGFSMGKQVYGYGNTNVNVLFDVLEKLGLGKVLYYPATEHATITSMTRKRRTILGMPAHSIECGVIAGYLSGYLGTGIRVHEPMCIYTNSDRCQFVAEPVTEPDYTKMLANPDPDAVINAIAERIDSINESPLTSSESMHYLVLPSMPLMSSQMLPGSSDILYLAGGKLARMHGKSDWKSPIRKVACYFDLNGVELREQKGKRVIRLKYKQYNSMEGLVRLSSSIVSGFLETLFQSKPSIRSGISDGKAYFMEMTV